MNFEFDQEKSDANKQKHGLDFIEAQVLWEDPDRLEVPARTQDEARSMLIGRIGDKYGSAVFTIRDKKNSYYLGSTVSSEGGYVL